MSKPLYSRYSGLGSISDLTLVDANDARFLSKKIAVMVSVPILPRLDRAVINALA
jgi:hypothetical protein